jgi:uncharacterized protein Yka (UPF0111/DUF47 family)
MLVETFPAAQLKAWGLPHASYADDEGRPIRAKIITHLEDKQHLMIAPDDRRDMLRSADALDAVLAAFGAKAAANRRLKFEKPENWKTEGAIAIHA